MTFSLSDRLIRNTILAANVDLDLIYLLDGSSRDEVYQLAAQMAERFAPSRPRLSVPLNPERLP